MKKGFLGISAKEHIGIFLSMTMLYQGAVIVHESPLISWGFVAGLAVMMGGLYWHTELYTRHFQKDR